MFGRVSKFKSFYLSVLKKRTRSNNCRQHLPGQVTLSQHTARCITLDDYRSLSGAMKVFDSQLLSYATPPERAYCSQQQAVSGDIKLHVLIADKIARQEFFYGVEMMAQSYDKPKKYELDYNRFGAVRPLFTALVWLSVQYRDRHVVDVAVVKLALELQSHTLILLHFICDNLDQKRLQDFLDLNFCNVLALRGAKYDPLHQFPNASDLVKEIKKLRGDSISIGVAGYPEMHPDAKSCEEDMQFLVEKVNAGADFIITQMSFSSETIINFVKNCQANGITIPIVIGVFIPESFKLLQTVCKLCGVRVPEDEYLRYKEKAKLDPKEFKEFAVQRAVETILEIFDSGLGIYGVQFFTLNRFNSVEKALALLLKQKNFGNNKS